ncbi:hypothetical protein [Natronolimnohabitans innermongolicus]|uniref:HIT-type domain-containing protein n=1 Tax=Natronolimnohabitans innermongolicus JCM 12255 TaxID=1227499 RepID=L9X795_9EURY|nr:hypothetical protein [Natronolimnohabitans innermongolicus]ELY57575.1 hypothetical protein C493_08826 [Natronolimnohabitans innermongolicus JCM 12255]
MSVSGLCQICESRPAQEQCANCGALVCDTHYEDPKELCIECAGQADPTRPSDSEDVDIHRF